MSVLRETQGYQWCRLVGLFYRGSGVPRRLRATAGTLACAPAVCIATLKPLLVRELDRPHDILGRAPHADRRIRGGLSGGFRSALPGKPATARGLTPASSTINRQSRATASFFQRPHRLGNRCCRSGDDAADGTPPRRAPAAEVRVPRAAPCGVVHALPTTGLAIAFALPDDIENLQEPRGGEQCSASLAAPSPAIRWRT